MNLSISPRTVVRASVRPKIIQPFNQVISTSLWFTYCLMSVSTSGIVQIRASLEVPDPPSAIDSRSIASLNSVTKINQANTYEFQLLQFANVIMWLKSKSLKQRERAEYMRYFFNKIRNQETFMLCFRKNRLKLGSAQTGHRRIERGSKELEIPVEIPKYNICFRMSDLREFELANRTWEEQIEQHGIRTDKPPADEIGSKRKRLFNLVL